MDKESWITAKRALEMGLVDEVMGNEISVFNCVNSVRLTDEMRKNIIRDKGIKDETNKLKEELLGDLDLYGV